LSASRSATGAVAEVLNECGVVSLHPGCGRCVTVVDGTVDHVKAALPLVQSQLKVGIAAPGEVLRAPFNVKDTVRGRATYRCEYAEAAVHQVQVVPVWEDGVVVGSPRQALVSKGGVHSHELSIAVGR
jgi:hypothetical protein